MPRVQTTEDHRLEEARQRQKYWKRWGPYLSERQWGTVREDYSPGGTAWEYFPHDHARSRAYRWGEDGLAGISDRHQLICFGIALWNGKDPILKERLFGLTGNEGNHAEDVKEYYFYLDSTPTHAYMKYLYKYSQKEYPYAWLVEENRRRGRGAPEFELLDTGIFAGNHYFDIFVEYAKADVEDILVRIKVFNRGPESAELHLLPSLWFRNTWSWGRDLRRPSAKRAASVPGCACVELEHFQYGKRWLLCAGAPELLFTENETNRQRVLGTPNRTPYVKDAFHEFVIRDRKDAVNPAQQGTKLAAYHRLQLGAGEDATIKLRLSDVEPLAGMDPGSPMVGTITAPGHAEYEAGVPGTNDFGAGFDALFTKRIAEAEEFYASRIPRHLSENAKNVMRQAFAGMLWSKQFYHYDVRTWLEGDPACPAPPEDRWNGRNKDWAHLYNEDVLSMPDKWEYPWYAAWDLAFHCIPLALVDPDFAKDQLILLLREWYMHPNGQLPAYEWSFSDVNPPVHAWAAWRVYKIERRLRGTADRAFLERVFHKLLLNFTWWVNRKDPEGMNIFQGGFLGLDNIGVFDRSAPLPTGGHLEQSDGTSWMGMYCLNMLAIALELAKEDPAYEDVASKFFEHFVNIAHAMNDMGRDSVSLWDAEDGFYYDVLRLPHGEQHFLKIRSMVCRCPGAHRNDAAVGARRPPLAVARQPQAIEACPCAHARRNRIPLALRYPRAVALSPGSSVRALGQRPRQSRGLRARRIHYRSVRRQFQLARAYLVSGELSAHRVSAEVPPLLWRGFQGRVPGSFAEGSRPVASRGGNFPAAHAYLLAREGWSAPGGRWSRNLPERSALEGARPLSRIFPWR